MNNGIPSDLVALFVGLVCGLVLGRVYGRSPPPEDAPPRLRHDDPLARRMWGYDKTELN